MFEGDLPTRARKLVTGQSGIPKVTALEIVMHYPKIQSVQAIDKHTLLIEFDNAAKKTYDVTPSLEKEMFLPPKNFAFFRNVQVESSGLQYFGMKISI